MKRNLALVIVTFMFSQQLEAARTPSVEDRVAFRSAVEKYQIFVVPRCAPHEVKAYVTAREDRDRAFIQSLRHTRILSDYKKAIADRAKKEVGTFFHCFGPPPPPPPPPGTATPQSAPDAKPKDTLAEHFAAGDQQFAEMLRLRNAALGSSNN